MLTDFEYMQGLKLGSRMAALGETRRSLWPSRTTESGAFPETRQPGNDLLPKKFARAISVKG